MESRGLSVDDRAYAIGHLSTTSYYRLSAYFLPFQKEKDQFDTGVHFDDVIFLYLFDRDLRSLIFEYIGKIEIAVRTRVIYETAHHYSDSHWQDDRTVYRDDPSDDQSGCTRTYNEIQEAIERALAQRKPEVFIKHYQQKYRDPTNPPSWMSIELLTMGQLSHLYTCLKEKVVRKKIANFFELSHTTLGSWLHSITYVRNLCAHHCRLWNKELAIRPFILKKPKGPWLSEPFLDEGNNQRTFYFICCLQYMMRRINPKDYGLRNRLVELIDKYPDVPIRYLGIPTQPDKITLRDWTKEPLWQ